MHMHTRTRKCGFSDLVLLEVRPSKTQLVRIEIFRDAEDPRYYCIISFMILPLLRKLSFAFFLNCIVEKEGMISKFQEF